MVVKNYWILAIGGQQICAGIISLANGQKIVGGVMILVGAANCLMSMADT